GTRRAALLLPLLVPAVVIGSGLFSILLRLNLLGRTWVLLIAHVAMALPFTVTILVNGVEEIDQSIWKAAASLGANLRTTVRKVIVPILAPSVIAAWVLAFM